MESGKWILCRLKMGKMTDDEQKIDGSIFLHFVRVD